MATHRISLLTGMTLPDSTGNAFFEPYPVKATNDIFKQAVGILNDAAADCGFYGSCDIPQNYVGTAKVYFFWTSTAITGTVSLGFSYRSVGGDDAESMDQATFQEGPLYVNDAAPSAVNERNTPSITLTAANLAAGDTLEWYAFRDNDSTGGTDNMAAAIILFDVILEYADA